MRIVEKIGAEVKAIAIVGAGGIRGSRDGYALVGWDSPRAGELADEPALGEMVIEHDRIAEGTGRADTAKGCPDRGDASWPVDRCPRCLVKDLIADVVIFNVLS